MLFWSQKAGFQVFIIFLQAENFHIKKNEIRQLRNTPWNNALKMKMCSDTCLWLCLEACTGLRSEKNHSSKRCGAVQCCWHGKPTGLQVQAEVEERSVPKCTQQVVTAFEGGHEDRARDDLWGGHTVKMIYFSFQHRVTSSWANTAVINLRKNVFVRKINRSYWSDRLVTFVTEKHLNATG